MQTQGAEIFRGVKKPRKTPTASRKLSAYWISINWNSLHATIGFRTHVFRITQHSLCLRQRSVIFEDYSFSSTKVPQKVIQLNKLAKTQNINKTTKTTEHNHPHFFCVANFFFPVIKNFWKQIMKEEIMYVQIAWHFSPDLSFY